MTLTNRGWEFWIDRGGTFTDVVARSPDGALSTRKLLSENPGRYADAALQAIVEILDAPSSAVYRSTPIRAVKMGTTVGTNALLERKGERTVLVINRGLRDALRIGYQNRPEIFALDIRRPDLLYQRVIEVDGRLDASGGEIEPLATESLQEALEAAYEDGLRAVAVVLMYAWRAPRQELAVGAIARRIGFVQVSLSHQVSPAMGLIRRGNTTVVDAYLSPVVRRYVDCVDRGLHAISADRPALTEIRLSFMQSHGGLTEAHRFTGKDSLLSGPAGGVIGAIVASRTAGFERIVTFDMGGTSTDVAHFAGAIERNEEAEIAGIRLHLPLLNIHTVAAGGGSILRFDGLRYRVGPDSAGADPGPACYRRDGPLCVTDANLLVGRLHPDFFPHVFGPEGDGMLDDATVRAQFSRLAAEIGAASGRPVTAEAVADGFLRVASESMANAIKKISAQRGYDLGSYTLCCFGAAGGQLACSVADLLGIRTIFLHPLAGVLSAYGMGLADHRLVRTRALVAPLEPELMGVLEAAAGELEQQAATEFESQGIPSDRRVARWQLAIRYQGSDTALPIDWDIGIDARLAFENEHRRRFGFIDPEQALIVETVRVELIGTMERVEEPCVVPSVDPCIEPVDWRPLYIGAAFHRAPIYLREDLPPGAHVAGPAVLIEPTSTTVIEPGWSGEITARKHLVLRRNDPSQRLSAPAGTVDPVMLEVFGQGFMAVAEQMGYTLQNTAHSVNIKERLDFSCAVFDGRGDLMANAPHIPVHLGSMGESVKALLAVVSGGMQPGEVYLTNSPYAGGTHLPDITVVTPVFVGPNSRPAFYVASRGHHADVGGITPGSMPPHSQRIEQEGVLASNLRIVAAGRFDASGLRCWLASGPYPARNPEQNLADLRAQIAANEKGVAELRAMVERHSLSTVLAYSGHVQNHAEAAVRNVIGALADGEFLSELDDGTVIRVAIRVDRSRRSAMIDFTGTSPQQANNMNAPAAICRAAVLYVFRTLVQQDIPLNAGCLRPLEVIIPAGSLLNPRFPAAVVAGNVETSQAIVDTLYGALGVLAASQGTMNNFTFGNERLQYYETVCGGAGAGAEFDGCDAVHTHMTNSRITDPEVLEWRFPVCLEEFSIRRNSGGLGRHCGGDGVVRRIRFLAPMTAGILSSHRRIPPFGLRGGQPGAIGCNLVLRCDGRVERLAGCAETTVQSGDRFEIATPGGGGYGTVDR